MATSAYLKSVNSYHLNSFTESDQNAMRQALQAAAAAAQANEVPVGAVVCKDGVVIASGHNTCISAQDPCGHAEINALRQAAQRLGNYRLDGCEMFVTLEPCAMCSSAMLQARLARVVFGVAEPRTGAGGSVLNLFALPALNHHTALQGGLLAQEARALLQDFFVRQRRQQRNAEQGRLTLHEDALRTPAQHLDGLPGFPWRGHYVTDLPALDGLALHYLDESGPPAEHPITWLCLHGRHSWSYLYRKLLPVFCAHGDRVVAPDLPGYGRSDKPKKESAHRFVVQHQQLLELVERLDLRNVVVLGQDFSVPLALSLPMAAPQRYRGLLLMNGALPQVNPLSMGAQKSRAGQSAGTALQLLLGSEQPGLSWQEYAAFSAPYPDRGHLAAWRATTADASYWCPQGAAVLAQALAFLQSSWGGESLLLHSEQASELLLESMQNLRQTLARAAILQPQAHHGLWLPEQGASLARQAMEYFRY